MPREKLNIDLGQRRALRLTIGYYRSLKLVACPVVCCAVLSDGERTRCPIRTTAESPLLDRHYFHRESRYEM